LSNGIPDDTAASIVRLSDGGTKSVIDLPFGVAPSSLAIDADWIYFVDDASKSITRVAKTGTVGRAL